MQSSLKYQKISGLPFKKRAKDYSPTNYTDLIHCPVENDRSTRVGVCLLKITNFRIKISYTLNKNFKKKKKEKKRRQQVQSKHAIRIYKTHLLINFTIL